MLNRFMISVAAAALVAGTGLANAQGNMGRDGGGGAGGAQMQQSQPSGGAAERGGSTGRDSMSRDKGTVGQAGGSSDMKSNRASDDKPGAMKDERSPGGAMNKNAAEDKAGATKGQRTDERAQDKSQQDKSKSMSQDTSKDTTKSGKDQKDMKAEGSKSGAPTNNAESQKGTTSTNQNAQGQTGTSTNQNAQGQSSTSTTVGQAGAGAKLSTEQRTQITSVIREQRVAPVTNVNFSVSIGTRVPREGISLHALPSRVVTIYPEWRAYKYIMVREQIVIIDPDTYEIVAVLDV
ncbi:MULTISPECIES: DUF1236 domain-containing protein [Bradyrhizobium]|uniref:DUF1236 domain-containing protein n=1 Tax=Bradyrhizobium TaxID=374 RepID=UPI001BAA9042|nr:MULTISPECIES: DUF1236 domain-containing protein [Bradyrhizobium]MBR0813125.1 DUF1236 domain-containing protein [Bradyrhizobium diazoefficiens]WOH70791.1 DUF1236 domain-containing protein [Bradyrhizobium sp. NDS-1]